MKSVEIDRGKRLRDQPTTGHNRFHPDIPPLVTVDEGEEVVLATRDGVDGQLGPGTSEADIAKMEAGAIHPLTGPVFVKGARPGDMLEVEFLDIVPQPHAFTAIVPGLGFLRDLFTTPFLVHWQIRDGWATAPKLPRVRIPGAPFMAVSGRGRGRSLLHRRRPLRAGRRRGLRDRGRDGRDRLGAFPRPEGLGRRARYAGRASPTRVTSRRRSGRRREGSSPRWVCRSGT